MSSIVKRFAVFRSSRGHRVLEKTFATRDEADAAAEQLTKMKAAWFERSALHVGYVRYYYEVSEVWFDDDVEEDR